MNNLTHGFTIDKAQCEGNLACMRACPTKAIRVKDGKASFSPYLCVDCGSCLRVCQSGAIQPTTLPFAEIDKFRFKVAVPSPVLLAQFPMEVSFEHIVEGLKAFGFDAVWDYETELALVNRAVTEYVKNWKGPFPLISNSCPVVVRLIQVAYPEMVDQIIRIQPPRELAGRELKRKYSKELGIDSEEIAAVYITPCQAKTVSILEPAERTKSYLDGALGISEVYNAIMATVHALQKNDQALPENSTSKSRIIRWVTSRWLDCDLFSYRYLVISGLTNVIQVFDDIEIRKLRNVDYLECWNCWDGCIGGNLTVDNVYITRTKIHSLQAGLPDRDPDLEKKLNARFPDEDFSLKGKIRPRVSETNGCGLKERVSRMKIAEEVFSELPGLDCGLCGAPTCKALSQDVAKNEAKKTDCVFYSDERLKQLRRTYMKKRIPPHAKWNRRHKH